MVERRFKYAIHESEEGSTYLFAFPTEFDLQRVVRNSQGYLVEITDSEAQSLIDSGMFLPTWEVKC